MIFLERFLCCVGGGQCPPDSAAVQPHFSLLVNEQKMLLSARGAGILAARVTSQLLLSQELGIRRCTKPRIYLLRIHRLKRNECL